MRTLLLGGEVRPGVRQDLVVDGARIASATEDVRPDRIIDLAGRAILPGLVDHHLHLFATAAAETSIDLGPEALRAGGGLTAVLRGARRRWPDGWLRGVGYDVATSGPLDRHRLDAVGVGPVRVQDRTGILWILDGAALDAVGLARSADPSAGTEAIEGVELRGGEPTGRLIRLDRWLGARVPRDEPDLPALAGRLAARGIVAVTDAGADNDVDDLRALASGHLPIGISTMTRDPEVPPVDGVTLGPVKILLDDADLPTLDDLTARVTGAHAAGRAVAVHCVTPVQLVLALSAGVGRTDRIEHGSWIPEEVLTLLAARNPTVVVQPGLVEERGDRYLAENDADDHADLHRLASLRRAGLRIAAGSDAPYGSPNPWAAITAAVERRTRSGAEFGRGEALDPIDAIDLFTGPADDPASPRRLRPGGAADLVVLDATWAEIARHPTVAATVRGGELIAGAWPG